VIHGTDKPVHADFAIRYPTATAGNEIDRPHDPSDHDPTMLTEALHWWAARMGELLPDALMQRPSVLSDAVIVVPEAEPGEPATLLLRHNRQESRLGVFVAGLTGREALRALLNRQAGRREVRLRPPAGALLERQVTLPSAAEPELRRVLGFEMNRLTPFGVDDVFWTWRILAHDRVHHRLNIRLSLVLREPLRPLIAALTQAGLPPTALETKAGSGPPLVIPLRQDAAGGGWRGHTTVVLASVCGMLVMTAIALPFVLQSLALRQQDDRIAAVQPQVTQAEALRGRLAASRLGQDAIAAARTKFGDTLQVLAAVTQLLPDDTYLVDLALRDRKLAITGQSASAARLIGALARDPSFHNAGFAAPVTRNPAGDRDVFAIRADVGP
jgi:general secretion pathway protein L